MAITYEGINMNFSGLWGLSGKYGGCKAISWGCLFYAVKIVLVLC
jgi:hypothetical protein